MSDMETLATIPQSPQAQPELRSRCAHPRAELVRETGEHFCPDCGRTIEYYDLDAEERGECLAEGRDRGKAWE